MKVDFSPELAKNAPDTHTRLRIFSAPPAARAARTRRSLLIFPIALVAAHHDPLRVVAEHNPASIEAMPISAVSVPIQIKG